jgi:hypothetical protein
MLILSSVAGLMFVENFCFLFAPLKVVRIIATIFFKLSDIPEIEAKHWTFQYES